MITFTPETFCFMVSLSTFSLEKIQNLQKFLQEKIFLKNILISLNFVINSTQEKKTIRKKCSSQYLPFLHR